MVQNRVSLALPQLPDSVQKQGLTIKKKSPSILLVINFFSPDGRYDDTYLSNYATINVKDELFRLEGVGDINFLGERDFSIRVWLDPQALASRGITASDVANAIQSQNLAAAPGQIGAPPSPPGQGLQLPLDTLGRLTEPEQFGDIIVKADQGGPHGTSTALVRLRDVARVELASQQYNQSCTADGRPSVGLAVYQLPGTNALDVAERVKAKMQELKTRFPEGLDYGIYHDTTPFIKESVADVVQDAADRRVAGGPGRAGVPAGLAGHADPADRRPGGDCGHLWRDGGAGFQPQQHFAVRAGAGDRDRGGRRHCGRRERRALAGTRSACPERRRAGPWTKSPGRSLPWPWCCAPCSCRVPSSAASRGSSFANSP